MATELRDLAVALIPSIENSLHLPGAGERDVAGAAELVEAALTAAETTQRDPGQTTDWLHHVTCRTVQSRMLLRPGRINDLLVGCLARALEAVPEVGLCGFDFESNHYHLLATAPDAPRLSQFMNIFQSSAAKEVNRTHDWQNQVWSRRYDSILVSHEPLVQLERMLYTMGQGCASGLVASPLGWPGATSHRAVVDGSWSIEGVWIDRTELWHLRKCGHDVSESDVTSRNELSLSKLPAFAHLDDLEYRDLMRRCVNAVEHETRRRHAEDRTRPLGSEKVLAVHPHQRPEKSKRGPAPQFHATRELYRCLEQAYRAFVSDYYAAAESLEEEKVTIAFPTGCFPPRPPVHRAEESNQSGVAD